MSIESIWELITSVQRRASSTGLFSFLNLTTPGIVVYLLYHVRCTSAEQCSLLRAAVFGDQFDFVFDPVCHNLVLCLILRVAIPVTLRSTSCAVAVVCQGSGKGTELLH